MRDNFPPISEPDVRFWTGLRNGLLLTAALAAALAVIWLTIT